MNFSTGVFNLGKSDKKEKTLTIDFSHKLNQSILNLIKIESYNDNDFDNNFKFKWSYQSKCINLEIKSIGSSNWKKNLVIHTNLRLIKNENNIIINYNSKECKILVLVDMGYDANLKLKSNNFEVSKDNLNIELHDYNRYIYFLGLKSHDTKFTKTLELKPIISKVVDNYILETKDSNKFSSLKKKSLRSQKNVENLVYNSELYGIKLNWNNPVDISEIDDLDKTIIDKTDHYTFNLPDQLKNQVVISYKFNCQEVYFLTPIIIRSKLKRIYDNTRVKFVNWNHNTKLVIYQVSDINSLIFYKNPFYNGVKVSEESTILDSEQNSSYVLKQLYSKYEKEYSILKKESDQHDIDYNCKLKKTYQEQLEDIDELYKKKNEELLTNLEQELKIEQDNIKEPLENEKRNYQELISVLERESESKTKNILNQIETNYNRETELLESKNKEILENLEDEIKDIKSKIENNKQHYKQQLELLEVENKREISDINNELELKKKAKAERNIVLRSHFEDIYNRDILIMKQEFQKKVKNSNKRWIKNTLMIIRK